MRGLHHCHARPAFFIAVCSFHLLLCLFVGFKISQNEVHILLHEGIIQRTEEIRILRTVISVDHLGHDTADIVVGIVKVCRMIVFVLLVFHNLLCGQTEDEGVVLANLFHDLHVGAIHGSDGHRAV